MYVYVYICIIDTSRIIICPDRQMHVNSPYALGSLMTSDEEDEEFYMYVT
jgi:hypothetical protein